MIELYYSATPNGRKVAMLLEELAVPYKPVPVNISAGDQFKPEFLAISPNNRIPAIVDYDVEGDPVPVFESGAIMWYLADKYGRFLSNDPLERKETMEWMFWQVGGQGPMAGQLSHFVNYAPEDERGYGQTRYRGEYQRLAAVLDRRLDGRDWIVGDAYSIADMIAWPWILIAKPLTGDISEMPNLMAWRARIKDRPATRAAVDLGRDFDKGDVSEEDRQRLYFQDASTVQKQ
ncbi:MAG: glutathione S-transferase N-terminal domain-containing protein [Pseudomonadota bacterium]